MRDPFLRDHRYDKYEFLVAGRIAPISIRDQMVRSEMFVKRALDMHLIDPRRPEPFIVVGGGAAGVTAAISAAGTYGIRTILVEREPEIFQVQAKCSKRWICPTAYDYPASHFQNAAFPIANRQTHLGWSADRADSLVGNLRIRVMRMVRSKSIPLTLERTATAKIVKTYPRLEVEISQVNSVGSSIPTPAQLVLRTTGFGKERRFLDPHDRYYGFEFWESDPFQLPNVGVINDDAKVLISGSGDGGLQDFIRIATGRSIAAVIQGLQQTLENARGQVFDAEAEASRSLHWNTDPSEDHGILQRTHNAYEKIVENLLRQDGVRDSVCALLADPVPEITLLAECRHFSVSYPLNHILALLIAGTIKEIYSRDSIVYNQRITDISGNQHTCNQQPQACHGKSHNVVTRGNDCFRNQVTSGNSFDCNVLVIRHGSIPVPFPNFECLIRNRQILPFDA